jgi:ubiquinone/menaquinone biosynthesis C-methylase UbiE
MNKYTEMQKSQYEKEASGWSIDYREPVVGSFEQHNNWEDYDTYLFKDIDNLELKSCLDFGCGPGRNMVKYSSKFKQLDGVDIAQNNIDNAIIWLSHNNCDMSKHKVYLCNGEDIKNVPSNSYDIIMSTICFQHICVHEIRYNLLKDFHRVLKSGGFLTMQMGYGSVSPYKNSVDYYDNNYNAEATNGSLDTRVESPEQLKNDLYKIGFTNFKNYITTTGPGDGHLNWIFFNSLKK